MCHGSLMTTKAKIEKVYQGVRMCIPPTHQVNYLMWLEGSVYKNTSVATKEALVPPPPSQKVDCYRSFEESKKRIIILHLPEN